MRPIADARQLLERVVFAHETGQQALVTASLNEMTRLLDQEKVDIIMGVFSSAHCVPMAQQMDSRKKLMWANVCVASAVLKDKRRLLARVEQLHEFNPMLGHRGVRLGITYPEITEMQTRAIIEAACRLSKEGVKVAPEIMIPLVGHVKELRDQKAIVDRVAEETMRAQGVKIKYLVGTMIEVPRGAMTADQIAKEAAFFSFGTNDLTQLTFGFSRDDVGKFLRTYQEKKILERDPFASIDTEGVGVIVQMCVQLGRKTRPDLKIGICGEHGGDPSSIHFFEKVGLDYVSASPYRVPVARLAAAQAALSVKVGD